MDAIITKLRQGAKQLRLNLNVIQIKQIEDYLALLSKWNRVFNLTAIRNPHEMLTHHVLDSLAIGAFLEEGERYLDVGTGAGLPGMILAILFPHKQFTLLDSNSKKTSFIKQAAHQLEIRNVTVVTSRVEDFKPAVLFDGVLSRAFTSLKDFQNLCGRLCNETGVLLAMKGPKVFDELKSFPYDVEIEKINVPFLEESRYVVKLRNSVLPHRDCGSHPCPAKGS